MFSFFRPWLNSPAITLPGWALPLCSIAFFRA